MKIHRPLLLLAVSACVPAGAAAAAPAVPAVAPAVEHASPAATAQKAPAPTASAQEVAAQALEILVPMKDRLAAVAPLLQGVVDKESADAAAAKLAEHTAALRALNERSDALFQSADPVYGEVVQILSSEFSRHFSMAECDSLMQDIFESVVFLGSMDPACFGSSALASALADFCKVMEIDLTDDAETEDAPPMSAELRQKLIGVQLRLYELDRELVDLMRSVKDKAGADAAAPRIAEVLRQQEALWLQLTPEEEEALFNMDPAEFLPDEADRREYYALNNEAMLLRGQLEDMYPPCYDSEALQDVFDPPPPEDEEADDETEDEE